MGDTMMMSPADAFAMTRDNDGMFGGNGCWIFILFILFSMFGGGGMWGGNNFIADEFIQRDIFNTNQNVSSTACQTQRDVLENRYDTQVGLTALGSQMASCCCDTQRAIDNTKFEISKEVMQNRYDNALQTQTLSAQMAECCCDIKTAIHADGEATRALITANTIQELRDNLQAAQLQLGNLSQTQTLVNTLRPVPTPAYITCSPYQTYAAPFGCGCSCGC